MKRKINRVGPNTLTVSLPSKWAKRYGLRKGDEINLEENGTSITLSTSLEPIAEKTILDVRNLGPLTRRAFDAIYKKGYDDVEIIYAKPEELRDVQNAIDLEARTFEIISLTNERCLVKSVSEVSDEEFDTMLRRTFILLIEMSKGTLEAWKNNKFESIDQMKQLEKTNNKFTHILRRSLNRKGYREYKNTSLMYTLVEVLEKIADELKFLCDYLVKNKVKPSKEIKNIFSQLNTMLELFYELFYAYDQAKAVMLSKQRKEIAENAMHIMETKKGKDILITHYILNVCTMTFEMFGPLMAM